MTPFHYFIYGVLTLTAGYIFYLIAMSFIALLGSLIKILVLTGLLVIVVLFLKKQGFWALFNKK